MKTMNGLPLSESMERMLQTGKKKYAWKVIHEFCDGFGKEIPSANLWTMLSASMQIESEEISAKQRANLIYFYEQCVPLFMAVQCLHESKLKMSPQSIEDQE